MQIDFPAGCHINEAAKMLVVAALDHGEATGTFNSIEIKAGPQTTPDEVVTDWERQSAARAEAYRNSPEGKKAAQEAEDRRSNLQCLHDRLMVRLRSLDMGDDNAVLFWLCSMQKPSDHRGVIIQRSTIVEAFEKAGFVVGANCGDAYKAGDRDNEFRYLVGQALDGLKNGPAIHPILHKFADEWRATWITKTQEPADSPKGDGKTRYRKVGN